MKQILRFAAVAMVAALSSSTALADNRTVPTPAGMDLSTLTNKDTVYVFNLGQKAWIHQGESWGTQATVNASKGFKYVIKQAIEENSAAEALSDGRYYLYAHETKNNHYLKRIADSKTGTDYKAVFSDGPNNSGNTIQWEIASLGNNVYSIKRPQTFQDDTSIDVTDNSENKWEYVDGEYLGVNLTHERLWDGKTWQEAGYTEQPQTLALWFDVQMSDYAKWIFVSPADYKTYAEKYTLKDALDKAEAKGVKDYSAEEAVFNKADATSEEIAAAVLSLNDKIADLVNPENPVDYTSSIQNPNFNDGVITGWTSTTNAQNNTTATNVCEDNAANPDGAFDGKFYENWNPTAFSGKMYQEVKNLPNGVYHCSLAAYTQQFDANNATNKKQYVYFNDTKLPLTTGNAKKYEAYIDVVNNAIEMGIAQDSAISQWVGIDNAQLEYYGNGLASYQFITTNLQSVLDELENNGDAVSTIYTQKLTDLISAAKAATTKDEAFAIYGKAQTAVDEIAASVQAYKDLAKFIEELEEYAYQKGSSVAEDALEVAEGMNEDYTLTTEKINEYIATTKDAIITELKDKMTPGSDATQFINNPAFSKAEDPDANPNVAQDFSGWTIEGAQPGAGGTIDKRLCEVYQGNFKIYQDLTGIQKGAYKLEIQSFVRSKDVAGAYNDYVAGNEDIKAWIFAGDKRQKVKSIFDWHADDEAPTSSDSWSEVGSDPVWYVPNTMVTGYEAMAMNEENYNNEVSALCIDGNLRIGFEANDPNDTGQRWLLFHDFKLTYLGNDASLIKPVLDDMITAAKAVVDKPMAAAEKTALTTALSTAETATAATDGNAMMSAFSALAKAKDAAEVSADKYAELQTALDKLGEEIDANTETATEASLTAAKSLNDELTAGVKNGTIANDEVDAKITAINLAIVKMKSIEGSDQTPADYSWAIKNADFADGTNNWTIVNGTATPSVADQVMEGYNGTFNVYQDIYNLPEGTYLVKCQGFYRYGWVDENGLQAAYAKDSIKLNAKLYANWDSIPLHDIIVLDELAQNAQGDQWKTFYDTKNDSAEYYLPNIRSTARLRFDIQLYPNELYTYVGKDGFLRIGFCNNETVSGDWSTVSDFELFYLGTESEHAAATGIESATDNAKVVSRQFFTVDGRRTNGLTRGLNIIKSVDAAGKTTVRKVIVK